MFKSNLVEENKALKKRLKCLEEYLGLFYTVDDEGYDEHKVEQDGYGFVQTTNRSIKDLGGGKKK